MLQRVFRGENLGRPGHNGAVVVGELLDHPDGGGRKLAKIDHASVWPERMSTRRRAR
jgi:hypothetical protein